MLTNLLVRLTELFEVLFKLFVFWPSCMVVLFGDLSFEVLKIIFVCGLGWLGVLATSRAIYGIG